MKQIAQNYKSGELAVLDVPVPACKPGGVLVHSRYSLISTGTEMMKVTEARMSLVSKARARPDQVRKLLDSVAQQGPLATYQKAMNRLMRKEEVKADVTKPAELPADVRLLTEIRDQMTTLNKTLSGRAGL